MIWKVKPSQDLFKNLTNDHMDTHLGIEFTEVGDDFLKARMPVNEKTKQPYGILHGGASCVLAESLGSAAGACCVEFGKQIVVGLEINANHLRPVSTGFVTATARPIHLGRTTQVWDIRLENEQNEMVCISRLTLAVKNLK